jgi:hypothetical protein
VRTGPVILAYALRMNNLLPADFPRRREIETAVRSALETLESVAWQITLRPQLGPDDSEVEVELRSSRNQVAFTSIGVSDSPQQIVARLRLFGSKC